MDGQAIETQGRWSPVSRRARIEAVQSLLSIQLAGFLCSEEWDRRHHRKLRSYTLCEVCNIQLNSAAQAQIHYNGKAHQKRLKQISHGKIPGGTGTSAQGNPLLASLPVPGRPLQPQLDIKHLLPFRLNGSSPLTVINHTFGVPQPLKKKQIISCNICHLRFNSTNQAEAHYKGHKHARKLKAMEAQKNRQKRAAEGLSTGRDRERDRDRGKTVAAEIKLPTHVDTSLETTSEFLLGTPPPPGDASGPFSSQGETTSSTSEETQTDKDKTSKSHLHCPVCKVTVNSASQLEAHNSGMSLYCVHLRAVPIPPGCKSKRLGSKGSVGVTSKNFQCEVCEIFVNSETQLSQHMNSRRHKDRLAGKPPKPKFTPHSKSQPSSSLATKLALQKQLTKTLSTSGFLHSPLSPPPGLCTVAATNPLALRHPMGTAAAFIQTPFLSPALFRPAPGPLRATHTPIIFSPY
uniref:Zinc finger protein 385C n=1 Tax=Neogobius melanostomus TaxID=47308 RepID=A0A8C6SDY6_9GOBI